MLIENWLSGKDSSDFVSLTKNISKFGLMICFIGLNLFLSELVFKWPMVKFLGLLRGKDFSSVKQSVSFFEGFKGLTFWLPKLEFSEDINILYRAGTVSFGATYTYTY